MTRSIVLKSQQMNLSITTLIIAQKPSRLQTDDDSAITYDRKNFEVI